MLNPYIKDEWTHVFDPNVSRSEYRGKWYTNDHCFARDRKGNWHAIGIIGYRPPNPWAIETNMFHVSTGKSLLGEKWTEHPYALSAEPQKGERGAWAPYILDEKGVYNMFYAAGNLHVDAQATQSFGKLCLATSRDLFKWKRHEFNPLFTDPGHSRDPFVMKKGGRYYFYSVRTFDEADQRSCVVVRDSADLLRWSGPRIVHIQPLANRYAGDTESPQVVARHGIYYLFLCRASSSYDLTDVYWSKNFLEFPRENLVCT